MGDRPTLGVFVLAVAVLAAAMLFGGSARRDLLSDFAPQVLSLFLLWRAGPEALTRLGSERLIALLVAIAVLVPIVHIVPLPAVFQGFSSGRNEVLAPLAAVGLGGHWGPISLRPLETIRSALALLPALSLLAAALVLSATQRRALALLAIAVALLNIPLGMLQILGGPESALYFYAITNNGSAVGFFANRNHYAALFYMTLPFCVAFAVSERKFGGVSYVHIGLFAAAALILGLSLSGSRTVLMLGPIALGLSYLWFGRGIMTQAFGKRYRTVGLAAGLLILAPLALGVGLLTIFGRLETHDVAADLRWPMAAATWAAGLGFIPFGAGLGSFERIYAYFEPTGSVVAPIVNHAHNDWLELFLETGLVAVLVLVIAVLWLLKAARDARDDWEPLDARLARAAVLAVALVAIHLFWDYPVRTIAISSLVALAVGLTFAPASRGQDIEFGARPRRRRRKSRSSRSSSTPLAQPAAR